MKIAIEGMDGSGKTTIAKGIESRYGYTYIAKPLKHFFGKDNEDALFNAEMEIYKLDDPLLKSWFFGMGNIFTFRYYQEQDLVIDRHFLSNYFWNGTEESEIVFRTMIEIIGKPDISIILYASPRVRLGRLHKRNPNDRDITDPEKLVDGYDKMIEFADRFDIPYVLINTENMTMQEVQAETHRIIDGLTRDDLKKQKTII